jgi:hypothetical protein
MEWKIIVHKDEKFIEVITQGVAEKGGSVIMAKYIMEAMRNNRVTKALIDHRNITGVAGDTDEIDNRPKILQLIGLILGVKIAEIIRSEHIGHFKYFETVCKNQGFKLSIFQEQKEAMEWLLN